MSASDITKSKKQQRGSDSKRLSKRYDRKVVARQISEMTKATEKDRKDLRNSSHLGIVEKLTDLSESNARRAVLLASRQLPRVLLYAVFVVSIAQTFACHNSKLIGKHKREKRA